MSDADDMNACAALVERGDPDRFLAAMSCPVAARQVLFTLYAFNLEIARAPWLTQEPLIAQMRLQWWHDALGEMADGAAPRAHEVAAPLTHLIRRCPAVVPLLQRVIDARSWDIENAPFEDQTALDSYLQETTGGIVWASALALGVDPMREAAVRARAGASGVANWLLAVPALESAGRVPLVDGRPAAVRALAQAALSRWNAVAPADLRGAELALRACWRAPVLLRRAVRNPARVAADQLAEPEIQRRARLITSAILQR